MARWQLYYHVVFGTKEREVTLGPTACETVRRLLWAKAHGLGCLVHAIFVRPDHAHMVLSIPPSRSISFVIGQLKGSSSHGIGRDLPPWVTNVWQEGYGVFSFAERDLTAIVSYVQNQDRRHADRNLHMDWEDCGVASTPGPSPAIGQGDEEPGAGATGSGSNREQPGAPTTGSRQPGDKSPG